MNTDPIQPTADERTSVVEKKATCPFIGSAVAQDALPIRNDANDPLAGIEDVRRLGNTGGGNLGDLLVFFASGNHAFMRGASGKLDAAVPLGFFSLDFPGSQGSHPGHSGILQGDPESLNSGRFSQADFDRLINLATDGFLKRSDVGRFIAENLIRDPKSKVLDHRTVALLAGDLVHIVESGFGFIGDLIKPNQADSHRDLEEKLTKLGGEDNLVGSSGEFGLLFAFFAHKPGSKTVAGEPALDIRDLKTMFVAKRLPEGWETWKKSRIDWVTNTTGLLISAANEYRKLKGTLRAGV
ncbi:MAG: hypothetical protein DMF72_13500 [Acidobacteria bacterium]|nr:MAG: hypothetical protein DMF72_13500 [Acidobacteriota bacterium]